MSMRIRGIWLSIVPGAVFLLAGSAVGDDQRPAQDTAGGQRVPARVVSPAVNPSLAQRVAQARAAQREPRVIIRDLRAREGFDALHDEYESFDRFFRFQRRIGERDTSPTSYYFRYPYRSRIGEYIALSEYERFRYNRDRHRREMEVRKAHLLNKHEQALSSGLRLLKRGEYEQALVALTLAAKLNHGDPACRIHLAQTRLARGHYREAGLVLRRALQLQPKLAYADLHLDRYYHQERELDQYTDDLDRWVREHATHAEVHFLLGYLEFQRGDFSRAHAAFRHAEKGFTNDDLTRDFLAVTKPATPVARQQPRPAELP
jgi:tetratricopeptide (TPR) repeat protein